MGQQQCDKCGEMVDEAKAFCPGCGNAFVKEEKRQGASKFEKLDPTIQFGHTMYNQLLEDMGLNISGAPNPVEKRVEVIAPVDTKIAPSAKAATVTIQPAVKTPGKTPEKKEQPPSNLKWYILFGVAVLFLLPIALASAILFVLDVWSRLK
jgi:hypothetical protein